jgi:hypothetical protein
MRSWLVVPFAHQRRAKESSLDGETEDMGLTDLEQLACHHKKNQPVSFYLPWARPGVFFKAWDGSASPGKY